MHGELRLKMNNSIWIRIMLFSLGILLDWHIGRLL
jgi:hypothetical protein